MLLLNNDAFLSSPGTVEQMARWASLPWVGTVGICLRFPDGRVQYSGLNARFGGETKLARIGHCFTEERLADRAHEVFRQHFCRLPLSPQPF